MTDIVDRLRDPEVFIGDGQMSSPVARAGANEIQRLRTIIRVNGLRWGVPNSEIDALLYPEKQDE